MRSASPSFQGRPSFVEQLIGKVGADVDENCIAKPVRTWFDQWICRAVSMQFDLGRTLLPAQPGFQIATPAALAKFARQTLFSAFLEPPDRSFFFGQAPNLNAKS